MEIINELNDKIIRDVEDFEYDKMVEFYWDQFQYEDENMELIDNNADALQIIIKIVQDDCGDDVDIENSTLLFYHYHIIIACKYMKKIESDLKKLSQYNILMAEQIKIKVPRKKSKLTMEEILEKKEGMSASTKKVYTTLIKRLNKMDFKFNQNKKEDVDYIVNFFETNKIDKLSPRLDLINIIIVLRTIQNLPTEQLKELRKKLSLERIDKNVDVMKDEAAKLLSIEEFDDQLKGLFVTKQYKAYVVNYLLRNFGVRNQDLDVEVVLKYKGFKPLPTKNYLIRNITNVIYIRNDYKTVKTYGAQKHTIKDTKFNDAVVELSGDALHSSPNAKKIFQGEQISNDLRKLIIGKMNESQVFKMLIDDAYKRKDTAEINRLSASRGTNVETINDFYNVNAEHKIIREI